MGESHCKRCFFFFVVLASVLFLIVEFEIYDEPWRLAKSDCAMFSSEGGKEQGIRAFKEFICQPMLAIDEKDTPCAITKANGLA